jgi:hypothetical protein
MIVDNQPTESQTASIQGQPEGMQLEQDESDWSDVEENRKVPVDMKVQEEGPAPGEVKSRHEVRLAAFKEMETDAERAIR